MPIVTRPAARVRQGDLSLYATSLTIHDLALKGFYRIDKLDPNGEGNGFQRLLNESRARKLADYLLDGFSEGDAFLPTSLFLATNKQITFDSATNTITFDTAQVGPFNVVDGQHRIAGLVAAAEKNPEMLTFEVPVNIAVGLDDVSQMCHFLIVNTTQRSVDKAVEQQIVARLTSMLEVEELPTIPRWIQRQVEKGEDSRALTIADYLNTAEDSPWLGKIRMANDEDHPDLTINQKSFVKSLKKYVLTPANPLAEASYEKNRPKMLSNYWKAIVELLVDDNSLKSTVIYKTNGVDLFHMASPAIFTNLATQRNFTVENIRKLLTHGFKNLQGDAIGIANPEWWQRGGVASGLNSAATRKLAHALSHAVNVPENSDSMLL